MFGQGLPIGFAGKVSAPAIVDFLVVAGGGGGGSGSGGGSGAGGLITSYGSISGGGGLPESQITLNPGVTYTINIGAAGSSSPNWYTKPGNGNNSYISGADIATITSLGGGGGGRLRSNGSNGGTGGGGGQTQGPIGGNSTFYGGTGTAGQGYGGGTSRWPAYYDGWSGGGGGGGAGGAGVTNSTSPFYFDGSYFDNGGNGGAALAVAITGTNVYYAGGQPGFAGYYISSYGNNGSWDSNFTPAVNSGGGAYSGIVILRILTSLYSGNTTGAPTITTDGDYTVLKYTGSGTYTH